MGMPNGVVSNVERAGLVAVSPVDIILAGWLVGRAE
jgi:hypothetical protein